MLAMIYTIGETSGAHLNPAVTLAFAVGGNFPWRARPWLRSFSARTPARSLGPALLGGNTRDLWIYLAGPVVGALLAVALAWVLRGAPSRGANVAAQGGRGEPPSGAR